ncbi:MAG: translation initiation factor IF-6 [Promethearchaeota archaeon]|nr:MAG: translation initiation factor IF-6 [Candidatus Lokiarchaeota archaeon]
MSILKYQIFGRNTIGVYLEINNLFGLYPPTLLNSTLNEFRNVFTEPLFPLTINNSPLIGVYITSNKNGIIVPHILRDDELENLKSYIKEVDESINIGVLDSIDNAYGNLILCNDNGAIISSLLKDYRERIEDILNVETVVYEFADLSLPGSISLANNKGCVVHPLSTDDDVEYIRSILKVNEIDVSTVNRGIPYIASGVVANDTSGIFGLACTGPEMMRLTDVLGL